jgi:hypothetical protein
LAPAELLKWEGQSAATFVTFVDCLKTDLLEEKIIIDIAVDLIFQILDGIYEIHRQFLVFYLREVGKPNADFV